MPSFRAPTSPTLSARLEPQPADVQSDDSSRRRTIVLLGIDGAGKTTTATALVASIRDSGVRAQLLRNPAGRRWMTRVAARFGTALTPAWADRLESVVRCTNVLLAHTRAVGFHGTTVMDRHVACQLVLRSVRGLPHGAVLPWLLARLPRPDAIILIDVPADLAYSRILFRGEDSETLSYLKSSREAYLEIARARGWHIIDGSGTTLQVALDAMRAVSNTDGGDRPRTPDLLRFLSPLGGYPSTSPSTTDKDLLDIGLVGPVANQQVANHSAQRSSTRSHLDHENNPNYGPPERQIGGRPPPDL